MTLHTHYDNLKVSRTAPAEVIRASYKALAQKYHPDRNPGDGECERVMKLINLSYAVLSNPEQRAAHDAWIAEQEVVTTPPPQSAPPIPDAAEAIARAAASTATAVPTQESPLVRVVQHVLGYWPIYGGLALGIWYLNLDHSTASESVRNAATNDSVKPNSGATLGAVSTSTVDNTPRAATPIATTPPAPLTVSDQLTRSLEFRPDLASAAIFANVRSEPNATAAVIRRIERGTPLQHEGVHGTFVHVRLGDGVLGWVAQELLIPQSDARRLSSLTAAAYISERAPEKRLAALDTAIMSGDSKRQIDATFASFSSPTLDMTAALAQLRQLAQTRVPAPASDDAAALWYTLAATAARNSGNMEEALGYYLAAVEAAPATGAHHSAIALAAYELGNRELLLSHAYIALALSPETTNSCLVFALALASLSSAGQPHENAAANTLRLAINYSRDTAFTARYLRGLATKATNPMVARAIDKALSN